MPVIVFQTPKTSCDSNAFTLENGNQININTILAGRLAVTGAIYMRTRI